MASLAVPKLEDLHDIGQQDNWEGEDPSGEDIILMVTHYNEHLQVKMYA